MPLWIRCWGAGQHRRGHGTSGSSGGSGTVPPRRSLPRPGRHTVLTCVTLFAAGPRTTPPPKQTGALAILEATSYFLNKEEVLLKERVSRSGPRKAASAKPARVQSFRQERWPRDPNSTAPRPRPSLRARTTSQIQARGRTVEPANPHNPRPNPVPWRSTWVSWRRGPWRPGWLIGTTACHPWACPACSLRNPGVVQAWFPIIDPVPTG